MNKWMVVVFPWPQNRGWFRPTHGELIRERVGGNESTAFIAGEHPSTRACRQTNRQVDQKRHDHDQDAIETRAPKITRDSMSRPRWSVPGRCRSREKPSIAVTPPQDLRMFFSCRTGVMALPCTEGARVRPDRESRTPLCRQCAAEWEPWRRSCRPSTAAGGGISTDQSAAASVEGAGPTSALTS